jgi:hypothetical protein
LRSLRSKSLLFPGGFNPFVALAANDFGDAGLAALAAAPYLRRLALLTARSMRATPEGAQALVDAPWLASLQRLEIDSLYGELDAPVRALQSAAPDLDIA